MSSLIDSNIMIDCLKGQADSIALLQSRATQDAYLYASEVSRAEILAGTQEREMASIEELFLVFTWISVDEQVSRRAGALASTYRKSHRSITLEDYMIAATALKLEAELLTRNVKDFPMFEGLESPY